MATVDALNLNTTAAAFAATWANHLAAKRNRTTQATSVANTRAIAQWGDLVDDFMIAAQDAVRLLYRGTGTPEGAVAAPVGSLYHRTDGGAGTTLYVKESGTGNTGWSTITSASSGSGIALAGHTARSIVGRAANSTGDAADIAGNGTSSAPSVPVDNGTTLAFRQLTTVDVSDVIYDVDFSTLADNTFADGNETIDGNVWVADHSALLGVFDIENGAGMRLNVGAGLGSNSTFTSSAQSTPYIYLPVESIPHYDPRRDLIVEAYLSTITAENSGEGFFMGVWGPTAVPSSTSAARVRWTGLFNSSGSRVLRSTSQTTAVSTDDTRSTHNIVGFRLTPNGIGHTWSGVYSSGFPRLIVPGTTFPTLTADDDPMSAAGCRFFLSCATVNDASPTSTHVLRRLVFRRPT